MCVSICVPGVLKDKADLQRGWGVEPRGPDVSARERLRRFYYVYNREKVYLDLSQALVLVSSSCYYFSMNVTGYLEMDSGVYVKDRLTATRMVVSSTVLFPPLGGAAKSGEGNSDIPYVHFMA